jgi:transcriptional regulator with XRE-family HTH domain
MNYAHLASELLRTLRGKRSQGAFSRRLGFKSNIAYAWESGRRFPTGAGMFRAALRSGVDVQAGLATFFRTPPSWLHETELSEPAGVVRLLDELRAGARVSELARRTGMSRFALARWFNGVTEPRLPDFLALVEATSLRLLDFLAALTDPRELPSVAEDWRRLDAQRRLAYELPWSQAVLLALELQSYRALARHRRGWIAARLGISEQEELQSLQALEATGQIRLRARRWVPVNVATVDTRRDAAAGRQLKRWWARVGLERLDADGAGQFSYNVFTVSEADLARLQELHFNHYQEMRRIIASSQDCERVVLTNLQLIPLDMSIGTARAY